MSSSKPVPPPLLPQRPTRADARRNYDRLVAAAEVVFAEQGNEASLDEIARRAGVGSGTLYRHFANREAVMTAVFWERVQALCAEGERLLTGPSPTGSLVTWLRMLIELTAQRGLATMLMSGQQEATLQLFRACRQAMTATAAPLLRRAQREGDIRPDLSVADMITFSHAIAAATERMPPGEAHGDRLLTLLVHGLRVRAEGRHD